MSDPSPPSLAFPAAGQPPAADAAAAPGPTPPPLTADIDDTAAPQAKLPSSNTGFLTTYVAGWAVLAIAAVGYLGTVAVYPELFQGDNPGTIMSEPEPNKGQRAVASAPAKASGSSIGTFSGATPKPTVDQKTASADTSRSPEPVALGQPGPDIETAAQAPLVSTETETATAPREPARPNGLPPNVITTADLFATYQEELAASKPAEQSDTSPKAADRAAPVVPTLISSTDESKPKATTPVTETASITKASPPLPILKPRLRAAQIATEARREAAVRQAEARRKALEVARVAAEKAAAARIPQTASGLASGPPIVTGSIDSPASATASPATISFGPAVVTRAPNTIGVQLATGDTIDALRLSWDLLRSRHGAALNGLQPRYTVSEGVVGRRFGLVAGPLRSTDDARRVCQRMQASSVPCTPSTFTGNSL